MMDNASQHTSTCYRFLYDISCNAVRTTITTVEMYVHVSSAVVRYQYYCATRVMVTTTVECKDIFRSCLSSDARVCYKR